MWRGAEGESAHRTSQVFPAADLNFCPSLLLQSSSATSRSNGPTGGLMPSCLPASLAVSNLFLRLASASTPSVPISRPSGPCTQARTWRPCCSPSPCHVAVSLIMIAWDPGGSMSACGLMGATCSFTLFLMALPLVVFQVPGLSSGCWRSKFGSRASAAAAGAAAGASLSAAQAARAALPSGESKHAAGCCRSLPSGCHSLPHSTRIRP